MTNGTRPAPAKQGGGGIPVIGWIAIGCGGILVLGVIGFTLVGWLAVNKMKGVASEFEDNPTKAAAELVVRMNPDLEMVESDEDAGTLTVREKSSGKVVTFNYEDIEEGRVSFETEEGRVEIGGPAQGEDGLMTITTPEGQTRIGQGGEIPDWVPIHPATSAQQSVMQTTGPSGEAGQVSLTVDADADDVVSYYKKTLESEGYEVSVASFSGGGESVSIVTGQKGEGSVVASVSDKGDHAQVTVQYNSGG
jgi:hypothetical protein